MESKWCMYTVRVRGSSRCSGSYVNGTEVAYLLQAECITRGQLEKWLASNSVSQMMYPVLGDG